MHKCFQVARTYLGRLRFWITGGFYLWIMFGYWSVFKGDRDNFVYAAPTYFLFGSLVTCFIGLHLRRQFGGPTAKMLPGFAGPHLAVGAFAGALVWLVAPLVLFWRVGQFHLAALAVVSLAGLCGAMTACWRNAIAILAVLPVALLANVHYLSEPKRGAMLRAFFDGDYPTVAMLIIAGVVLAHVPAAYFLLRLSDRVAVNNDDLIVELDTSARFANRWHGWNLSFRDRVVERKLSRVGRRLWSVDRWRVPVATSWIQLAQVPMLAILIALLVWPVEGKANWRIVTLLIPIMSSIFLLAPFGPWHAHRQSMEVELLRQVTRVKYCRQKALALAIDVVMWAATVSCDMLLAYTYHLIPAIDPDFEVIEVPVVLSVVWGLAALSYGVGFLTLRIRYWLPVLAGFGFIWFASFLGFINMFRLFARNTAAATAVNLLAFSLVTAVVGLVLARISYRRWLEMDVP